MRKKANINKKGKTHVSRKDSSTILHKSRYLSDKTGINKPGKADWNEFEAMRFETGYRSSARKNANNKEFERRFSKSSVKRMLRLAKLSWAV